MKPLVRYYGGKQRMTSKILPLLPPHRIYVEPFAGGAALFFTKPPPKCKNDIEVLNDHSELLINLYRQAQTNEQELLHRLNYTPYSEAEHRRAGQILRNPEAHDDLTKAWAYYTNIQMSFSACLGKGWGRDKITNTASSRFENYRLRLPDVFSRLRGVYIACEDALECIRRWDGPDTLFYCDPPYPETDTGHYKNYTRGDFQALVELAETCQGAFVVSSYDNIAPLVPDTWQSHSFNTSMSANKNARDRNRTEMVWVKPKR